MNNGSSHLRRISWCFWCFPRIHKGPHFHWQLHDVTWDPPSIQPDPQRVHGMLIAIPEKVKGIDWWFDGWWIMVQYSSWSLHQHQSGKDIKDFSTSVTSVNSILNPFSLISSQLERNKGWKMLEITFNPTVKQFQSCRLELTGPVGQWVERLCMNLCPNPSKSTEEFHRNGLIFA